MNNTVPANDFFTLTLGGGCDKDSNLYEAALASLDVYTTDCDDFPGATPCDEGHFICDAFQKCNTTGTLANPRTGRR